MITPTPTFSFVSGGYPILTKEGREVVYINRFVQWVNPFLLSLYQGRKEGGHNTLPLWLTAIFQISLVGFHSSFGIQDSFN